MLADKELHLMIIWNLGLGMKNTVLEDLGRMFKVLMVYEVTWAEDVFAKNISRFYGKKLWDVGKKIKECGNGSFLLITFLDEAPVSAARHTNAGMQYLNSNIFDLKQRYRQMASGSFSVHATNSPEETKRDLYLLLGLTYEHYIASYAGWSGSVTYLNLNTCGLEGFSSLNDAFKLMGECCDYVLLSDYGSLSRTHQVGQCGDIDILVADRDGFLSLLCANKCNDSIANSRYFALIAGSEVFFNVRCVGDGYYDATFQENILKARVLNSSGVYVADERSHMYSLLYDALIHSAKILPEHSLKVGVLFSTADLELSLGQMQRTLDDFMSSEGYRYTVPADKGVYFNMSNVLSKGLILHPEKVKRSIDDFFVVRFKRSGMRVRIFQRYVQRSIFRLYFSLGGIFKFDFSIGRVREL
jgi:hypothetical protein